MEKKKVMLVDDEEDFLKLTKLNLEATGRFEVLTLASGIDIVPQLHNFKPDILVLDILMPKVDGIEICHILNDDPVGQQTPLIILSALFKETDKREAYKLGVFDYVVKPVDAATLISKIDKALGLY
jgi:two-component system alkaline phosphatase synthesis response regulator PhoP